MRLRIIFAGTPHFSIPSLEQLIVHHDVCAVYTKPDSPSGRGLKLTPSPVKQLILDKYPSIPVYEPCHLKEVTIHNQLRAFQADIMAVIAYGLIIPKEVISIFPYGCINVHASLLPRWRGAAPIQRAILAGDHYTGVTIMQIDQGLDTGDILNKKIIKIQSIDTALSLHNKLAKIGAGALLESISQIQSHNINPEAQDNSQATYAAKIVKDEAMIDWQQTARQIDRHIRAFNPWPVAYTYFKGQILKIWEAQVISSHKMDQPSGQVVHTEEDAIDVVTGEGSIRLKTVQMSGGKPVSVRNFLNARGQYVVPFETVLGE